MIGSKIINSKLSEFNRKGNISLEKIAKRANRAFIIYFALLAGMTYLSHKSIENYKRNTVEEIRQEIKSQEIKPKTNTIFLDTIVKEKNERVYEISKKFGDGNDFLMYINKNDNYMHLFDVKNNNIVYKFNTSDAINQGVKEKRSDRKTPEGLYRIVYAQKSDNPFFGKYKININYPNEKDRDLGRYGNGILICGPGNDYRKNAIKNGIDSSNGGILLQNDDLEKLYNKIQEGKTLVVIEHKDRPLGGI